MRLIPFTVDITPPVGHPLAYGLNDKVDTPIYLRGLIFDDRGRRVVLAAAEIIGFYGGSYYQWRQAIARATRTPVAQVLLHVVHQHDSLMPPSPELSRMMRKYPDTEPGEANVWAGMLAKVVSTLTKAVRSGRWQKVEGVGSAEKRLSGLAANRRLLGPNGKVRVMRWSMTTNPELQKEPVGRIDPLLRSIGFFGARGRLLATLHFYATHPMGAYGRRMVSSDVPGVALKHLRAASPGATHIYLTGCGADVTFGKYTTADKKRNLRVLGGRLGAGLVANTLALRPTAKPALGVKHVPLALPIDGKRNSLKNVAKKLAEAKTREAALWPAAKWEVVKHWKKWSTTTLTRLDLSGETHILSLPAETAVEMQLFAQAQVPDRFLACAAYGNLCYQYLCSQAMFDEGGYEPSATICSGKVGARYFAAIENLLADLK
ncbi:MAG TPA: hypothetical protein VL860_05470 [Planctomycetota bacterium]|nr:hypothetical protein [Planctomycetota bacterium]